jgi:hypothetical protein
VHRAAVTSRAHINPFKGSTMNFLPLLVAAIAVLPLFGAAAWVWFAMSSANEDLRSFTGFEGMHFED